MHKVEKALGIENLYAPGNGQMIALLAADRDDLVIGATRAARLRLGLGEAVFTDPRPVAELLGSQQAARFDDADRAVTNNTPATSR